MKDLFEIKIINRDILKNNLKKLIETDDIEYEFGFLINKYIDIRVVQTVVNSMVEEIDDAVDIRMSIVPRENTTNYNSIYFLNKKLGSYRQIDMVVDKGDAKINTKSLTYDAVKDSLFTIEHMKELYL